MLTATRTFAVEVQRGSLQSGPGKEDWRKGLARHFAKRIGEILGEEKEEKKEKAEEEEAGAPIKSSNPHVAGGEKCHGVSKYLCEKGLACQRTPA